MNELRRSVASLEAFMAEGSTVIPAPIYGRGPVGFVDTISTRRHPGDNQHGQLTIDDADVIGIVHLDLPQLPALQSRHTT